MAKDIASHIGSQTTQEEPTTLTGKFVKKAKQLNAMAKGTFEEKTKTPSIDNQEESLVDAQYRLEFALGERLALDVAYRSISLQQHIIPLLEEDNNLRNYKIVTLDSGHGGIIGNILIPSPHNDAARVYVNFRGTDSHTAATFHLDLEHCAGEESFHRHLPQIMRQINEAIAEASGSEEREIELIISGHSLGSALSQYCLNAAMLFSALHLKTTLEEKQVDSDTQALIGNIQENFKQYLLKQYCFEGKEIAPEDYQYFSKIRTFKINSWGTLGVSKALENNTNVLADILKLNGKNIVGRFLGNTLDVVRKLGEGNSLSSCNADVAYLEIEDRSLDLNRSFVAGSIAGIASGMLLGGVPGIIIGGATAVYNGLRPLHLAHGDCNFGKYGELLAGKQYRIFSNETLSGKKKISEISEDKLTVFQKPLLYKAKSVLKQAGNVGSEFKKSATVGIVEVIKAVDRGAGKAARIYCKK